MALEGQLIGPYKIIAQVGTGGMATVYKAYHARLDRTVAIKIMHAAFQEDAGFLARFEREAQIVARLEHPHIVPVYDFADLNGQPYLVMKYVEGRTLKAAQYQGGLPKPLPLDQIVRVMEAIAGALDYAHRQGVLHRDIKPSNIILAADNTPYITDFGLARMAQLGDSTLSHDMLLGTPHYISPEQAQGSRDLTPRTDLYSLGVVLYELVVGRVPYSGDTPLAVIHSHVYSPLPKPSAINPEIPPAVDTVLMKALDKNPVNRYATAGEMVDAFKAALLAAGVTELDPNRAEIAAATLDPVPNGIPAVRINDPDLTSIPAPLPYIESSLLTGNRVSAPKVKALPVAPSSGQGGFSFEINSKEDVERLVKRATSGEFNEKLGELFSEDEDDIPAPDDDEALRRRVQKQIERRNGFFGHATVFVLVNAMLLYFASDSGFLWSMIPFFGWGAGLVAHGVETFYKTGERATRRAHAVQREYYRLYGDAWATVDKAELKTIRLRVEKPFKKREDFVAHLGVFIMINAMLAFINLSTSDGFLWFMIPAFFWGLGLLKDAFDAFAFGSQQRAVERMMDRERAMLSAVKRKNDADDKPKRETADPRVRLTSDGEFTDSLIRDMEPIEEAERQRRG